MMTSPTSGERYLYAERRARHAEQTRQRAARKRREAERQRLLALGADPTWIEQVIA